MVGICCGSSSSLPEGSILVPPFGVSAALRLCDVVVPLPVARLTRPLLVEHPIPACLRHSVPAILPVVAAPLLCARYGSRLLVAAVLEENDLVQSLAEELHEGSGPSWACRPGH